MTFRPQTFFAAKKVRQASIYSSLILLVFFSGCSVQKKLNLSDWDKLNLEGKIKSIRQTPRYLSNDNGQRLLGEAWPKKENNSFFHFNKNGDLIEKRLYLNNGENYSKEIYSYNEDDQRVKEILYNPNGSIGSTLFYEYDRTGSIAQSECTNYLGVKYIYKYDGDGNRIATYKYYGDGTLYFKASYRYDKDGNCLEEKTYTSEGKLFSKWMYEYDKKDNRIIRKRYFADGELDCKLTYDFDNNHREISWKMFDNLDKTTSQGTYIYEYDTDGNWIKRTKMEGQKPVFVLNREIEYFE